MHNPPSHRHRRPRRLPWRRSLIAGVVVGVVVAYLAMPVTSPFRAAAGQPSAVWNEASVEATPSPTPTAPPEPVPYPGAAYLVEGGVLLDVPYQPNGNVAHRDRPITYDNDCHQSPLGTTATACEFGTADGKYTIALVGDSHSAHWLPALQVVAEKYSWRIVSITKSGCRLGIYGTDNAEHASCRTWNANVIEVLEDLQPDLVLTRSTIGSTGHDYLYAESTIPKWEQLEEMGLAVVAIRDNPWYEFNVAGCVLTYGPQARRCGADREQRGLGRPIVIPDGYTVPSNVRLIDLTDLFCEPTFCPAVIGNVLVTRDDHHFSATYSRSMGPYLAEEIIKATGWPPPTP